MDQFLKMDVFFVVTTVVVVILGGLLAVILWKVLQVLKSIEHISEQAALESDLIRQDMQEMRREVKEGKSRFKSLFSVFGKFIKRTSKKT